MIYNKFLLILIFLGSYIYLIYTSGKAFHMLQDNLYNENNRYLKWIIRNKKEALLNYNIIAFLLLLLAVVIEINYFNLVMLVSLVLFYLSFIRYQRYKNLKDQAKRPLVVTTRVKRLLLTFSLLYLTPFIMCLIYNKLDLYMLLLVVFMTAFNYFVVLIAMLINMPLEKMVFLYYKTKASRKLKSMTNLKIIAVTGSYGKTSLKNIIKEILSTSYNCFATPKSINTLNGSMIQINNHLTKYEDVFISEMGAYVRGEIKALSKLIKPKYGALTTIGLAHLETFGSEENIRKAKFELIESLPEDGLAVLNLDDEKQKTYPLQNKVKIKWVSLKDKKADIYGNNIKITNNGTSFDVTFKKMNKKIHFETKLLGDHNIYNILEALAFAEEFNIDDNKMFKAVSRLKPTEHRLEIKQFKNFTQIDDAYNSNPVGAKNALKVLSMMDGFKVVVTPGMIELGSKEDELNKEFGKQIAEVADRVILVGEKKTVPIKEGLIENNYNEKNIYVIKDVRESYNMLTSWKEKNIVALYENDLPDSYNE